MKTNTCILGTRDEITGEWGIHRHGIQLSIVTEVRGVHQPKQPENPTQPKNTGSKVKISFRVHLV